MKASKRRARVKKHSRSQKKIEVAASPSFSDFEEAFFREGAALSVASSGSIETFADLEEPKPRPSLWRRLFN